MGQQSASVTASVDVTLVTTTETVIATLSGVSTPRKRDITLKGWAQITTGTNTTGVTLRIRRGTTTSDTLVGEANTEQVSAAAGSTEGHDVETIDPGIDMAAGSYVLTAQLVAATANGASLQATLTASWSD